MRIAGVLHWGRSIFFRLCLIFAIAGVFGLPVAGEEAEPQGWNVILLIDQSGSMFTTSDPCDYTVGPDDLVRPTGLPLRQWGAVKFIDYLGIDPVGQDQVGIIYFGTEPGSIVDENRYPLFPVTDLQQSEQAKEFLKKDDCPPDMSWTNTNKALEAAYDELSNRSDDREQVVILLTDGKPELTGNWPVEDTPEVQGKRTYYARHFELIEQYKEAGIKLFIMALGRNAQLEDPDLVELGDDFPVGARKYRDLWDHAAAETEGEYYKVEKNDQLWTTYHAIAAKLQRVFPGVIIGGVKPEGTLNENFEVPEASRMVITVERDPQTISMLFDPNGTEQQPTRSDQYYQIYSFANPTPGRWTLQFEGPPTRYSVFIDWKIKDLNIEVLDLPQVHPVGKSLPLRARITDDSGNPLEGVSVQVMVTGSDGNEEYVSLGGVPGQPGVYSGQWTSTDQLGDYALLFIAVQGEKRSELEESIALDELLYLELLAPQEGDYVEEAKAQVAIRKGGERVPAVATGETALQLDVTLSDSDGNEISTLPLSGLVLEDNVYTALFESVEEDDYSFHVLLHATDEGITDTVSVGFHLRPTPPPPPTVEEKTPEPRCLQGKFDPDPVEVRAGEAFQLVAKMDTSELDRPVVVNVELEAGSGIPVELKTPRLTLPEGLSDTPAELDLAANGDAEFQPGWNSLTGNINFSVEGKPPFCSMSFSVDVWAMRMWLPESNLVGTAGGESSVRVEYNTLGQQTVEPVQVSLAGVSSEYFDIDEEYTTLKPEADKHSTLDIPIHIDEGTPEDLYRGQLIFTYPDNTQDVSEFSLEVGPPPSKWWLYLVILGAVLLVIVGFVVLDPLCLRCKLRGQFVYPDHAAAYPIDLSGNKQVLALQDPSGGTPSQEIRLVLRAQKKKPPMAQIQQAPNGVEINGRQYREGEKVELQPDMTILFDSVKVKYEVEGFSTEPIVVTTGGDPYDYDGLGGSDTSPGYDGMEDSLPTGDSYDSWRESDPVGDYDSSTNDSLSGSPYDQPDVDDESDYGDADLDYD